ncbi:hypothetical protein [Niabella beijingensis]|uniref:hypothetical protein n=1 Tax=Niabella beijingensis TaxID=2872700 RepID=UPI001CBAEBA4|nr:hypothetical protein [Niabella beijingensis]MBZ4192372.1 hypothetical protein [Niabella beijingensis]
MMIRLMNSAGYKRLGLLLPAIAFLLNTARAQDITGKIERFAGAFTPERAYIHFDKSSYSPGETVWFKAYLLSEIVPAEASKTFYIDWIDDKGKVLQHTASPLVNGMTNGQFDLPATYSGKSLTIKAYTSWMLNFDSSFLYSKKLPVVSATPPAPGKGADLKPTLTFFPEGGDAVAGIAGKMAYKAVTAFGDPVKLSGVVVDEAGKFVDSLRNIHDGMGYILLNPRANGKYTAKWKDDKKNEYTTPLPAVKPNGVVLKVGLTPGKRSFEVAAAPGTAGIDSIHVIGTMYQHPVFTITRALNADAPVSGSIPLESLPYGILTITVFDKDWKPLAERITYVNNTSGYAWEAGMEVEHWGLSHRGRNELVISLPEAIPASLSVAVTDLAIGGDSTENILSTLMLTGELKGKVSNPAYYFKDSSLKAQQNLDLVMLTNGWRRFNWEKIMAGELPSIRYPRDTAYISVSGKLAGIMPSSISPASSIIVMMTQKDAEGKVLMIPITKDGRFNDPSSVFFDTARVAYKIQDKTLEGSMVQFMPDKLRVPDPGNFWTTPFKGDTAGSAYHLQLANAANAIAEKNRYKELEAVTVAAKTKSPVQLLDEKYSSGLFKGDMNSIQFDVLNDPFAKSAIDIFTYLQGKVAGLQISGSGSNASLNWRGGSPQIYIDEMPADVSFASSINVNDIAYIKAFRPPFMGGTNGANGAIAIYTRRGDDIKPEPGKGLSASRIEGYTAIREFYVPKYYSEFVAPDADKDVRTTIYWNPNVVVDANKKQVVVSFYNNDVTDAFRVVIQGMTVDGKLIHHEENME